MVRQRLRSIAVPGVGSARLAKVGLPEPAEVDASKSAQPSSWMALLPLCVPVTRSVPVEPAAAEVNDAVTVCCAPAASVTELGETLHPAANTLPVQLAATVKVAEVSPLLRTVNGCVRALEGGISAQPPSWVTATPTVY